MFSLKCNVLTFVNSYISALYVLIAKYMLTIILSLWENILESQSTLPVLSGEPGNELEMRRQ